MVELDLQNKTSTAIDQSKLKQKLNLILHRLSLIDTLKLEISLVGDSTIQTLNAQYRQKNQPTDVLSFENPLFGTEQNQPLGSLVISSETAKKQAKQAGTTLQQELEVLSVHGLLHLLGYHHT